MKKIVEFFSSKQAKAFVFGLAICFAVVGVAGLCADYASADVSTSTINDMVDEVADTGFDIFQDVILGKVFLILIAIALIGYIMRLVLGWLKRGGR